MNRTKSDGVHQTVRRAARREPSTTPAAPNSGVSTSSHVGWRACRIASIVGTDTERTPGSERLRLANTFTKLSASTTTASTSGAFVPGAIFAGLLSLSLSFGFSWYVQTFVRTASYGPLAAMMGFLLWTWLTVQIVIMGAEFNAEIEHQTAVDTTTGAPRPIGERGAVVADSVGPKRGNPAALAFTLRHAEALSDRVLRRRIRRQAERD